MRRYTLNIAGYNIGFESPGNSAELIPSKRFSGYISNENNTDILITIHTGSYSLPPGAVKVFDAPLVEDINGIKVKKRRHFWSVYKYLNDLFIETVFPLSPKKKTAQLRFSLVTRDWDLWFNTSDNLIDPMEYPLDGLILYYLTVIHGDILIHAAGINNAGRGFLFSGISGMGKTTMARIWDQCGAKIIHDDRLILRKNVNGYLMYNTPVYNNDKPCKSHLHKIFLIEHGRKNELCPLKGAERLSRVVANCVQHNWNPEIIARLLGSVSIMCKSIPVAKLRFKPDRSVIDLILENE
jgi:hypothetical protein